MNTRDEQLIEWARTRERLSMTLKDKENDEAIYVYVVTEQIIVNGTAQTAIELFSTQEYAEAYCRKYMENYALREVADGMFILEGTSGEEYTRIPTKNTIYNITLEKKPLNHKMQTFLTRKKLETAQ